MNLLNSVFNSDDIEIVNLNKNYLLLSFLLLVVMIFLLIIKKDNYYENSFNYINEEIVLLVEKDYLNSIQTNKEIYLNDIKCDYSINKIEPLDNNLLISICINTEINNVTHGTYKIYLGKERLFDYIIKTIK